MAEPEHRIRIPLPLAVAGAWGWRIVATVAAAALLYLALVQLYVVVVPVVLALFLASVLEQPVAWLRRRGLPSALAALGVFLGFLALVGVTMWWIGSSVAGQFEDLGDQIDAGIEDLQERLQKEPFNLSPERVDQLREDIEALIQPDNRGVATSVVSRARVATEFVGGVILMFFSLFFILKDGSRIADWIKQRIPDDYIDEAVELAHRARFIMRQYLIATATTGFIDAVLIAIALAIIGVPLILPLAVLTFFGGFFPLIGATLAGAVAALVALVNGGFGDAALVVAATIIVQQFEGNVLQPFILERAVRLHALVTILSVAAGLVLGGLLGAFIAVPLVAFAVAIGSLYRSRVAGPGSIEAPA